MSNLSPAEIVKALSDELFRMRKVVADAELLRPRIKKAERFINEMSSIWEIPLPTDLLPPVVPVRSRPPKPEGITVVEELTCTEPNCGREFKNLLAFRTHRNRASCDLVGPGHGKDCPNHKGRY